MAVTYEDVTFALSEDIDFALPVSAWAEGASAEGGDISEWLADAGLMEGDIEADVGTWLSNMGSGALNFGTTGATIGGPWGALIGGLLGAGLGAAQTVASDQQQQQPQPKPGAARPPAASPPRPAQSTPPQSAGGADVTAILAALRDVLPALTTIAAQVNRPRQESLPEAEPAPEVATDWTLEDDWPYAQEGVEVEAAPAETAETETTETEAEEAPAEAEDSPGESEDDEAAERLSPPGEAYAGAGLAQIREET